VNLTCRFFYFALTCLFIPTYSIAQVSLFKVYRSNYKPDKVLQYNLNINGEDCSIADDVFDIFYLQDGERIELSATSRDYYLPRVMEPLDNWSLDFSFKALEQFSGSDARIRVYTWQNQDGTCGSWSFAEFLGQIWELSHFKLTMKLIFGIPTGLDYGIATGYLATERPDGRIPWDVDRLPMTFCAYGDCPEQLTDVQRTLPM